ncbi:MAG: hypothetical protein Q8Q39_02290 [bacterium]|nr:hypothetical protein [bacterium]
MQYKAIFSQQASWALVIGFSVAIAALLYGLWLISPRELAKFARKAPAPVMQMPVMDAEEGMMAADGAIPMGETGMME